MNSTYLSKAMNLDETLQAINFPVEKTPVFRKQEGNPVEIPNTKAVLRTDTQDVLGIVSDNYRLLPNAEIFTHPLTVLDNENGFKTKRIYLHGNGQQTFVEMISDATFGIQGKEAEIYRKRLIIENSYDKSTNLRVIFGIWRQTCSNGAGVAVGKGESFRMIHMGDKISFKQIRERMIDTLTAYNTAFDIYLINLKNLADKQITDSQTAKILTLLNFGKRIQERVAENINADNTEGTPATIKSLTMLSVFNGITQYLRDLEIKKQKIMIDNVIRSQRYMAQMLTMQRTGQIDG